MMMMMKDRCRRTTAPHLLKRRIGSFSWPSVIWLGLIILSYSFLLLLLSAAAAEMKTDGERPNPERERSGLLLLEARDSPPPGQRQQQQHRRRFLLSKDKEQPPPKKKKQLKDVPPHKSTAYLFTVSEEIRVIPPSHFPAPTQLYYEHGAPPTHHHGTDHDDDWEIVPVVTPVLGHHRPEQDAIFAYAEGYKLSYYMQFLETLTQTGYVGDVVLAIAEARILRPQVWNYLSQFAHSRADLQATAVPLSHPNVIVYQMDLDCEDRDGGPSRHRSVMGGSGDTDIFQMCRLPGVYGWQQRTTGQRGPVLPDARPGRAVATLRYEWYWIWSQRYQAQAWILLLDARDSYFQSHPLAGLPRPPPRARAADAVPVNPLNPYNLTQGLLYFYGENTNATRLGLSRKNANWLRNGYGDAVLEALADRPTLCSGSTAGQQVALETYLRALIQEHEESTVRMTGSDQGFHNYLYYSGKLLGAVTIEKLVVWEQGQGLVNNVGAMRTQPLEDWGIYDPVTHAVYQEDRKTLSPVVHQFDRDKHLHTYVVGAQHRAWQQEWEVFWREQEEQQQQKHPEAAAVSRHLWHDRVQK